MASQDFDVDKFQSSRSLRTATYELPSHSRLIIDISILAVLADRDAEAISSRASSSAISILAVLADRDDIHLLRLGGSTGISILAVLADRDWRPGFAFGRQG